MSDTTMKIESETALFDILAKYGISKVILKFNYDGVMFRDTHDITFEGATTAPDDVRDAIRLAVETSGRARANELTHDEELFWYMKLATGLAFLI
jgi:hypothetical protein